MLSQSCDLPENPVAAVSPNISRKSKAVFPQEGLEIFRQYSAVPELGTLENILLFCHYRI